MPNAQRSSFANKMKQTKHKFQSLIKGQRCNRIIHCKLPQKVSYDLEKFGLNVSYVPYNDAMTSENEALYSGLNKIYNIMFNNLSCVYDTQVKVYLT